MDGPGNKDVQAKGPKTQSACKVQGGSSMSVNNPTNNRSVLNFRKTLNLSGDEVSWLWWRLKELEESVKSYPEIASRILKKLEVKGHYEK